MSEPTVEIPQPSQISREKQINPFSEKVKGFVRNVGSFLGRGPFGGRTRTPEHSVDPREALMVELQVKIGETVGTPSGAAFAAMLELERNHPGSVKIATEIDPENNTMKKIYVSRVATLGGYEPGSMPRTELYANKFDLPDGGHATRLDISVGIDGEVKLHASEPRDRAGSQFARNYAFSSVDANGTQGDYVSRLMTDVANRSGFSKIDDQE